MQLHIMGGTGFLSGVVVREAREASLIERLQVGEAELSALLAAI